MALRLAIAGLRHRPRRRSVTERIAALPGCGLPLREPVQIRWNDRLVPYIEARSDRDLATALGLVHAHLRLAQMEMLRHIAQGRTAEVLGMPAVPLDHTIRALDPARAVPAILAGLPAETRDWLEAFVAGINHHLAAGMPLPLEFRLLGIKPARWTVTDILTIARLAAADVNWLLWMRLLRLPRGDDWPDIWTRLIAHGTAPLPSLGSGAIDPDELFARAILGSGRAGSNALAVSGWRSATGQPWLAGDPHLSLGLPNVWLAAAYRSPSYNVAGLMIPGIPVMVIGRNPDLAWGGTNLHAASSELFDVSALPSSEIRERRVGLQVRWSKPQQIVLRDTSYGPIVSDAPLFADTSGRALALRWIGHEPSDEITAPLAMNRATDIAGFRRAAGGLAVPGQNLVVADAAGHVARFAAAWLPRRGPEPPNDMVSPIAAADAWSDIVRLSELPVEIDPPRGFVVSANDRPVASEIPVGWFFSPRERVERMTELLRANERIGLAELAALQGDVTASAMLALRDRFCATLVAPPENCPVFAALSAWDGSYDADSAGALAFELVLARVVAAIVPAPLRAAYGVAWHSRMLLADELDVVEPKVLATAMAAALAAARPAFRRLRRWGAAHRLHLGHPFGALPIIGRRYRYIDWPWPGGNDTLLKSAHDLVERRHTVSYGSNARYVFDLSDPDANRVVILGGQDGAPGSAAFLDQAELIAAGEYLDLPLRPATARARFPHCTVLMP